MFIVVDGVIEASKDNFEDDINSSQLVVIDFWAEWCGPCKRLMPVFKEVAEKMQDKVKFIKVDVDNMQEVASEYQVMSIPTLIFIRDGQEIDRVVGAPSKDSLESKIKSVFDL